MKWSLQRNWLADYKLLALSESKSVTTQRMYYMRASLDPDDDHIHSYKLLTDESRVCIL